MEYQHILGSEIQFGFIQNVVVFQTYIILFIEETLLLYSGHVKDIQPGHDFFKLHNLFIGDVLIFQHFSDIIGNPELIRRDKDEAYIIITDKGVDQGVHGTAEFKVTAKTDGKTIQTSLQGTDSH